MAILYALVARNCLVLAEHSEVQGNVSLVAISILEKLAPSIDSDTRESFVTDQHVFHILRSREGFTYLCMTEESFGRRLSYAFLEDLRQEFEKSWSSMQNTTAAYALQTSFAPYLQQRIEYFSSDPRADTVGRIRGGVLDLKNVMIDSIDNILERGDRLELLVSKTENLSQQAFAFKTDASRVRNMMYWKRVKTAATIAGVVILLLYILTSIICSPTLQCH